MGILNSTSKQNDSDEERPIDCSCILSNPELDDGTIRDASMEWFDDSVEKKSYGDITCWNTKGVKNMMNLFERRNFFENDDLNCWDTSHVTSMYSMFKEAEFDGDIGKWDVNQVEKMTWAFGETNYY